MKSLSLLAGRTVNLSGFVRNAPVDVLFTCSIIFFITFQDCSETVVIELTDYRSTIEEQTTSLFENKENYYQVALQRLQNDIAYWYHGNSAKIIFTAGIICAILYLGYLGYAIYYRYNNYIHDIVSLTLLTLTTIN